MRISFRNWVSLRSVPVDVDEGTLANGLVESSDGSGSLNDEYVEKNRFDCVAKDNTVVSAPNPERASSAVDEEVWVPRTAATARRLFNRRIAREEIILFVAKQ